MISHKILTIIYRGNFEKGFLGNKRWIDKIFWHFLHASFLMFILLISNHTGFLVQFGINLHFWIFLKAEIAFVEAARAISAFWKTHSCKLIPTWTQNIQKFIWIGSIIYRHICYCGTSIILTIITILIIIITIIMIIIIRYSYSVSIQCPKKLYNNKAKMLKSSYVKTQLPGKKNYWTNIKQIDFIYR